MRFFKGLAGQTLIYGLGTIVPRLLNYLLLTPFYTRIFGDYQYGTISELYAYSSFLLVLLTLGMETTYFRYTVKTNNEQKVFSHTWFSTLILSFLFISFTLIFNHKIANCIGYSNHADYIKFFAFIVFFDVITAIPFARLRNQNKALKFVTIKLINIGINIVMNVFFFVICKKSDHSFLNNLYSEEIGLGYAFISNLIASGTSFLLLIPEYKKIDFKFSFDFYKDIFKYSWPLIIIGVGGMINETADKILLKFLTPDNLIPLKQVGIYSANYKLAVLMTIFIQMFKYAAEPYFFKKSVSKDATESYKSIMDIFVIFCLFIFLAVTLYMDVFKYFIGSTFHSGLQIVPIILLANMFLGIYFNLSIWYKVTNKTLAGACIATIGVLLTLLLNILFIPKYGYLASAWATLICYFIMMVISYIWGNKVYPVKYNIKKLTFYTIFAIILVLIKASLPSGEIIMSLLISTLIGLSFVLIVLYFERNFIRKLIWK